jgi:hypothetical protein
MVRPFDKLRVVRSLVEGRLSLTIIPSIVEG